VSGVEEPELAVAYLLEQAGKFRVLEALVDDGMEDVKAGRISEWEFDEFLRQQSLPG
jgi:hypothetical protein